MDGTAVLALAIKRVDTYEMWQIIWFSLHYIAGLIAIIAGGLATAAGAKSGPPFIQSNAWVWGLLATLLSGVVTFLGPLQKAESYKHAYYELDQAVASYKDKLISTDDLRNATNKAQEIVLLGYAPTEPPQKKLNEAEKRL